jgi:HAD superfamily hydrolase (TIGR01490 family)
VEAAFFDLDKTVIARASIMAFARDFRAEGLVTRRTMAKGLWTQMVYVHLGASPRRLERARHSVLAVTRGWQRDHVRGVVTRRMEAVIDPITFVDAVRLIAEHRAAGQKVYLVSAAPVEIVAPLARHLGADEALASVPCVDAEGCYTGELERYAYGATKASLVRELAERDGLNLADCYAYSDSATDVPMLEAVGHPVAVNPDRALRRIAQERQWEIRRFEHTIEPIRAPAPTGTAMAARRRRWVKTGSAAAALAAAGGAGAVAWRSRAQPG